MSRKKKKEKGKVNLKQNLLFELYGLILLAISIVALYQPGRIGEVFRGTFRLLTGNWEILIPLAMIFCSFYIMWKREWPKLWRMRTIGLFLLACSLLIINHQDLGVKLSNGERFEGLSIISETWKLVKDDIAAGSYVEDIGNRKDLGGGMVGAILFSILYSLFDQNGTKIIVFFLVMIGIMLVTGISYINIFLYLRDKLKQVLIWLKTRGEELGKMLEKEEVTKSDSQSGSVENKQQHQAKILIMEQNNQDQQLEMRMDRHEEDTAPTIHDFTEVVQREPTISVTQDKAVMTIKLGTKELENEQRSLVEPTISSDQVIAYSDTDANYQLPSYSLLYKPSPKSLKGKQDIASNVRKLEATLESFGVGAKVTQVHRGPAVTRYEVYPDVGVKVSKIVGLTDDIALALAARGIRMEAPIPGKSAIGIEVPNEDISLVTLREVLESQVYYESSSKLSVALGRDISGEPIVAQLNKMPHLLVAGSTGSGKSVCVNSIIVSLLFKAKPHEVKMLMIDPKMVELNMYNGIPHLLAPVVTDSRKASLALKKVVAEMERRYEVFAQSGTRDIERYNDLIRQENKQITESKKPLLPYIVVIIDELADLMMVAPGDVEDAICRLAQMARAAGIHLIIATQRPSVDVITGLIKANIPSRIAFGVSSQADSRTILDMGGAEKLLGRGDMLFLPMGASKALRVQGAFLTDQEVEQVVSYCTKQQKATYHEEMIPSEEEEKVTEVEIEDDLYDEAVQFVGQQGNASVSMLQRRFRIGYNRAARLMDTMEARGVVGPYEGTKPREVYISKEENEISS